MTIPQSAPQTRGLNHQEFERAMNDLQRDIGRRIESDLSATGAGPAAADRPPVSRQAPAPGVEWSPSTTRFTSPLALLAQVADHAHSLAAEMAELIADVTGEDAAMPRQRTVPKRRGGLLPAVAHYATDIADAQAEIARQMIYIRERLG